MHGHKHAALYILIATHTGVDHVWSLCSCCLDCLEDVHCSFNFDSLNFRHASDEHTSARHAITGGMSIIDIGELLMSSYICAPTHTCTHAHMHTQRSTCMSNHPYTCFADSLAHDHQRCLALFLLVLHFSRHLQQGVNWRTALSRPREEVEQSHLKGRLRALQTTVCEGTY